MERHANSDRDLTGRGVEGHREDAGGAVRGDEVEADRGADLLALLGNARMIALIPILHMDD